MQISIINGIYSDGGAPDFRTSYPRNLIPVPKQQGISQGYLRPADGIEALGSGPGINRGGINWDGKLYRVMGAKLCQVSPSGDCIVLGEVGGIGPVAMDYSFDRLAIASGGRLFYWDGAILSQVVDPDLGAVFDVRWSGGYFLTTDGVSIVSTDINNPLSVTASNYGSAEADPDGIQALDELRTEIYAFGRYTVEVMQNVGGSGFPFQRVEGAQVTKGIVGRRAYTGLGDAFIFVGSGRGEAPAVYQMVPGNVQKVSTREIDQLLLGYTESQLAAIEMETRVDKGHQHVLVHLPDQCLVYDTRGSAAMEQPVWFTLTSSVSGLGQYRARGLVWCYDQWNVADTQSAAVGRLTSDVSTHWGETTGWEFGTQILYAGGNAAIVHELELVCLTGRVAVGSDPVIWTSYSHDGQTWSQERQAYAGKQGQRRQRICWRTQGSIRHWRVQRFRGTSDAHLSIARLEAQVEQLFTKSPNA